MSGKDVLDRVEIESEPAITPRYRVEVPNAPVVLDTGPVAMSQGKTSETLANGAVAFEWLPLVGVVVRAKSPGFQPGPVRVSGQSVAINGDFTVIQAGAGGTRAISTGDVIINHATSKTPSIDHVDVHLLNLPDMPGSAVTEGNRALFQRQTWQFGDWHMMMDPLFVPTGAATAAKTIRGNLFTHVIRAARHDCRPFKATHVSKLLDALYLTLSFAFGDHIGAMLAAGRNAAGHVVYELFRPNVCQGWRPRFGPAPVYSGIAPMMESLGAMFVDPDETLRETVWWYLESCWCMIEASVVLTQASLERLGYLILVKRRGLLKERAFDELSSADNIRLMMRVLDVPTGGGTKNGDTDIPDLITTARNNQVHSRKKGKKVDAEDARESALQTLELLLLRLAGYEGRYHPRRAKHAADELVVPWVK